MFLALWGVAAACGAPDASSTAEARPAASRQLDSLLAATWEHRLEVSPQMRLQEGVPVERLPRPTFEAAASEAAFQGAVLDVAGAIDGAGLTPEERVVLETLRWEAAMAVEGHRYFWLGSHLTPYSAEVRLYRELFARLPLETADDLDRFVDLVSQVPAHVRQVHDLARGQLERGVVVPAPNLPPATGLVRAQIAEPDMGSFRLQEARVSALDAGGVAEARARVSELVRDSINPALAELADFLEGAYADAAPNRVGISQYPEGRDYYLYLTRLHSTMDITPEEVRAAGHELLADFRARMAEIRERLGWEGTAEAFHEHLKTDPRYFPSSPEEVGERLRAASRRMAERVPEYFHAAPEAPWDAERLALELEPAMTYGYYSPPTATEPTGKYYYNGSNLDERSWLGLSAISLHELIPGHHFQIAGQLENGALPNVRRSSYYTAYNEGWGSYASFLGLEAGVFEDLYSEYGLYVLESFLATRLVVDPGMNYFGMSLDEARRFMRENTLESDTQIATESLRYSTDLPGQALGYQMGKRGLLDLRAEAEARLGERLDIRDFHDVVLRNGAIPMVVLEGEVRRWIESTNGTRAGGH